MTDFRADIERLHDWTRKRPAILRALLEMTEDGIRAASYESDRTTGHTMASFCWEHQQDPHDCNANRNAGDPICMGEPIPGATDLTGETAIRSDRARRLTAELDHAENKILTAAGQLYNTNPPSIGEAKQTLWIYVNAPGKSPAIRQVSNAVKTLHRISTELFCEVCPKPVPHPCAKHTKRSKADIQNERKKLGVTTPDFWCAFCGNEPPRYKNPTDVGGRLPIPRLVGTSCYDRIRATGSAPTRRDLEYLKTHNHKWPPVEVVV